MSRLLDQYGNHVEYFHSSDADPGRYAIEFREDVEPQLDAIKALRQRKPSAEFRHAASIPVTVLYTWIQRYGVDPTKKGNEALLHRLLNDPEWAHLRVWGGRLKV